MVKWHPLQSNVLDDKFRCEFTIILMDSEPPSEGLNERLFENTQKLFWLCSRHLRTIKDSLLNREECQLQYDMYNKSYVATNRSEIAPEIIPWILNIICVVNLCVRESITGERSMRFKLWDQIWAQQSHLPQRTEFHFYVKFSGHDRTHPTIRVTVHGVTKAKINKTPNITFLVNMEPKNLSELPVLCFNVREPRKHKKQYLHTNAR
jgi:hypothetical protein